LELEVSHGFLPQLTEEMTELQHVGKELGVSVIIAPKFHAEMAGEGIEYSWGGAKCVYCCKPLESKRKRQASVNDCTRRAVLTIATVQKLSRRARLYICAYLALHQHKVHHCKDNTPTFTLPLIEHLLKEFKTHRAAVEFDAGFVRSCVSSAILGIMWSWSDLETMKRT
jgi:hypothetical protein